MLFYTLVNDKGEISFSPIPELDKLEADFSVLEAGLPLGFLQLVLADILQDRPMKFVGKEELAKNITLRLEKAMKKAMINLAAPLKWQTTLSHNGQNPSEQMYKESLDEVSLLSRLRIMIAGRQLAEGELKSLAIALGINSQRLLRLLHMMVLNKQGNWIPAIKKDKNSWKCMRCGSLDCQVWPSMFGETATCKACHSIGALNSLQVLFRYQGRNEKEQRIRKNPLEEDNLIIPDISLNLTENNNFTFKFSLAQERAARELATSILKQDKKEILVWAACGAGKTEVSFPVIQHFLEEGKNILFAAPRQDVVHDIKPRLEVNFPHHQIKVLSGAISPDWRSAHLIVATTHQVLRFYRCFDLIIFDEMDAYPYTGNKFLERGLWQALKEEGTLLYLSATPSQELIKKVKNQQCSLIRLPIRHHGYPVPVPEFLPFKLSAETKELTEIGKDKSFIALTMTLRRLRAKGPLLIFVPEISMVLLWTELIKQAFKDECVEGSWSNDPARRQKVADFLEGNCNIFICTSILERGITVNNVQVAVLFAQHELYDTRSLVQMAGRTGRTSQNPTGEAIFLASQRTKAIKEAISWITEQNREAFKEGFAHEQ